MDSSEPTYAISEYVAKLAFTDLPAQAVVNAKTAILDTIGVALAGSQQPIASILADYLQAGSRDGYASVFGQPNTTTVDSAALINGTMAHAMDYDDRRHASTHVLPAAMALGEATDATGAELLLAYIAGREVRMALNEEIDGRRYKGLGPGARGWHSTGTLGSLGATAAAAKMLRLDTPQVASAFGVAASLASGLMANFGTMTKPLHAGNAARNGVMAASLVNAGFTGDPAILSARNGLVDAMCHVGECDLGNVVSRLQGSFHIVEKGVEVKPYPSCSGSHPYIETILDYQARYKFSAEDVIAIETTCSGGLTRRYPTNELECKFSAAYVIAVALLTGGFQEQHCTQEFMSRSDVRALLSRTTYLGEPWGENRSLRITLRDGRVIADHVLSWRNLTTSEEVDAKFFDNATPVIGKGAAAHVHGLVASLENVRVRELMSCVRVD